VTYLFTEAPSGRFHVLHLLEDDTALSIPEKERFSNLGINYTVVQINYAVDGVDRLRPKSFRLFSV